MKIPQNLYGKSLTNSVKLKQRPPCSVSQVGILWQRRKISVSMIFIHTRTVMDGGSVKTPKCSIAGQNEGENFKLV